MPPRPTTSTGPTLGATPSSSSSRSARTWCVAIVLVGVQLLVLRGLTGGLDVNVHDEAHYWRQARLLVAGDFAAFDHAWSLPLVAIHAALLPTGSTP